MGSHVLEDRFAHVGQPVEAAGIADAADRHRRRDLIESAELPHQRLLEHPGESVTVDLEACEVRFGNHVAAFKVEPFARRCLMDGVDTLGWLIGRLPAIEAFEQRRSA